MQMNRIINFVTAKDDTFTSFTTTPMSEGQFQRKMFKEFLLGNAGYVCKTLVDFWGLFVLLRHTNICMFNANYEFPDNVPKLTSEGKLKFQSKLPSAFPELELYFGTKNQWKGVLVWLLPQDVKGSYDVSPAFIESVGEILGYHALNSIKRMEYIPVKSYCNSSKINVTEIPWASRSISAEDLVHGEYDLMKVNWNSDDPNSVAHPIFNVNVLENKSSKLFYAVRPDFNRIGSIYLAEMIEAQLKYRKTMRMKIGNLMDYVLNTLSDVRFKDKDPSTETLMKAQAIIAWLLKPQSNNVHLYFKNGAETLKKLTSIAMFCNIVIPPTNNACVGVFMDMQGMIQIEEKKGDIPSGYRAIEDCDDAIDLIHYVIESTIIKPTGIAKGPKFTDACRYPYFDNVPSIFWNGNAF